MEGHGRLKLFPTICLPSPPSFGANGFPGGQRVSTVADRRGGGQKRTVVDHGRFLALELTGYPTPAPRAKLGQLQVRSGPLVAHIHGSGRAPTLTQPCPRSLLLRLLDPAATLPIPAKSSTAAPQPLCSLSLGESGGGKRASLGFTCSRRLRDSSRRGAQICHRPATPSSGSEVGHS